VIPSLTGLLAAPMIRAHYPGMNTRPICFLNIRLHQIPEAGDPFYCVANYITSYFPEASRRHYLCVRSMDLNIKAEDPDSLKMHQHSLATLVQDLEEWVFMYSKAQTTKRLLKAGSPPNCGFLVHTFQSAEWRPPPQPRRGHPHRQSKLVNCSHSAPRSQCVRSPHSLYAGHGGLQSGVDLDGVLFRCSDLFPIVCCLFPDYSPLAEQL
jgi:hypothetical protein